MALGFGHHCDIRVHVGKSSVGHRKFVNWWDGVASYFCALAVEAVAGPSRDVGAERGPDKFVSDHLPGPFDARMAKTVDDLEYSFSP